MVGHWMTAKPHECWYYVCSLSPLQVRVILLRPLSVGVKVIMIWRNRHHLPMELPLFQTSGHDGSQDKQTQVAAIKRSDIAISLSRQPRGSCNELRGGRGFCSFSETKHHKLFACSLPKFHVGFREQFIDLHSNYLRNLSAQ
jgi:hypothetical protein